MDELKKLFESKKATGKTGREMLESMNTDTELKNKINALSIQHFGKRVSGCSSCFLDAYTSLLNLYKQNNLGMTKFKIKAGAVIRDPKGDSRNTLTMNNVNNALAVYHLANNPKAEKYFTRLDNSIDYSKYEGKTFDEIVKMLSVEPLKEGTSEGAKEGTSNAQKDVLTAIAAATTTEAVEIILSLETKNRPTVQNAAKKKIAELALLGAGGDDDEDDSELINDIIVEIETGTPENEIIEMISELVENDSEKAAEILAKAKAQIASK